MEKKTKIVLKKFVNVTFVVALAMLITLLIFLVGFLWQRFGGL